MSDDSVNTKRSYDNSGRAEQAKATRHRVLRATYALLIDRGYTATTIKAIAAEAGVSQETIYKAFGGKARLLKDVYDVTLVGDEEPLPLAERPEFKAIIAAPTAAAKLAGYAAVTRMLSARLGTLLDVLLAGAKSGDPDLVEFAETIKRERLIGATMMARAVADTGELRPGIDADRARDIIWTLNSPEVFHLLVGDRGWSADEYEAWLAQTYIAQLLPCPETPPRAGTDVNTG